VCRYAYICLYIDICLSIYRYQYIDTYLYRYIDKYLFRKREEEREREIELLVAEFGNGIMEIIVSMERKI
jgi:hypothetical protein